MYHKFQVGAIKTLTKREFDLSSFQWKMSVNESQNSAGYLGQFVLLSDGIKLCESTSPRFLTLGVIFIC